MDNLRKDLENWQRYGGYLIGLYDIFRRNKDMTLQQVLSSMQSQNYFGGWSEGTIRNVYNNVHAGSV